MHRVWDIMENRRYMCHSLVKFSCWVQQPKPPPELYRWLHMDLKMLKKKSLSSSSFGCSGSHQQSIQSAEFDFRIFQGFYAGWLELEYNSVHRFFRFFRSCLLAFCFSGALHCLYFSEILFVFWDSHLLGFCYSGLLWFCFFLAFCFSKVVYWCSVLLGFLFTAVLPFWGSCLLALSFWGSCLIAFCLTGVRVYWCSVYLGFLFTGVLSFWGSCILEFCLSGVLVYLCPIFLGFCLLAFCLSGGLVYWNSVFLGVLFTFVLSF